MVGIKKFIFRKLQYHRYSENNFEKNSWQILDRDIGYYILIRQLYLITIVSYATVVLIKFNI